jgi:predicted dithiol-disulfide oxidoreductase (DUF899 family)
MNRSERDAQWKTSTEKLLEKEAAITRLKDEVTRLREIIAELGETIGDNRFAGWSPGYENIGPETKDWTQK